MFCICLRAACFEYKTVYTHTLYFARWHWTAVASYFNNTPIVCIMWQLLASLDWMHTKCYRRMYWMHLSHSSSWERPTDEGQWGVEHSIGALYLDHRTWWTNLNAVWSRFSTEIRNAIINSKTHAHVWPLNSNFKKVGAYHQLSLNVMQPHPQSRQNSDYKVRRAAISHQVSDEERAEWRKRHIFLPVRHHCCNHYTRIEI